MGREEVRRRLCGEGDACVGRDEVRRRLCGEGGSKETLVWGGRK